MSGLSKLKLVILFEDELLRVADCTALVIAAGGQEPRDSKEIAVRLQALVKACSQAFYHIIQEEGNMPIVLLSRRDVKACRRR